MDKNIDIGGRLHSTATGNIVTGANEVYDDDKSKKQSEINAEVHNYVENINNALQNLNPEQQEALNIAEKANNNEAKLGYYVCDTESNVATKVVSNATGYVLSNGGSIKVKMTNANTVDNATLNINSTGAIPLYYDGERASANNTWEGGETLEVYYDGTNYYANNVAGGSSDGILDVSVKYPTSGVEGGNTYTLEGALSVLNSNLSSNKKKGGMSIKFVHTSDNKYIQYRLMAQAFTIDVNQWAICDDGIMIENPEFSVVFTDKKKRIIVAAEKDGNVYFGFGVPKQIVEYINNNTDEILAFLEGFPENSTLKQYLDSFYGKYIENPEFLSVLTDKKKRIIAAIKPDGDVFFGFGCPSQIQEYIEKYIYSDGNSIVSYLNKVYGHYIEDPENRMDILTDSKKRIMSYRDEQGLLHENVGIVLSKEGLTSLAEALKKAGVGVTDWSKNKELHIEEPRCAIVNFTNISGIPQTKNANVQGIMEFWDMQGNYFKKEAIMNAQGRSTLKHPKKSIATDICNNNGWDDDDTFKLQIGDWVPQDSFHLKAFYNDPFRCLSPVAYKLNDEILKTRGEWNDYVWKRALLDLSSITATSTGCADADDAIEGWNTGARCFPMGFPCIVYLNGEFYGIYSWQLKKHRDNYMMSKKKTKHIHLDGLISGIKILNADGDPTKICWTTNNPEGVEIRNPKPKKKDGWDLVLMDGTKYDADANGGEIMSPTMIVEGEEVANPNWDETDTSHTKSYEVKQYILNLSKVLPTISAAYDVYETSEKTAEDANTFKAVFETYFDVPNLIDYLILSDVLNNYDGMEQNVQWITYNGIKWYLCAYDLDGVMGNWWQLNDTITTPRTGHFSDIQFAYLPIFYNTELEDRYKELRDNGILTPNHIASLVIDWMDRVGNKETFDKEWEKWPQFIKNDNIHRLYKWLNVSIANMDLAYHYSI